MRKSLVIVKSVDALFLKIFFILKHLQNTKYLICHLEIDKTKLHGQFPMYLKYVLWKVLWYLRKTLSA